MEGLFLPGAEFSRLPRTAESTKQCSELKLWVVGLHRGNVSNVYTRAKFFTRNQDWAHTQAQKNKGKKEDKKGPP